MKIIKKGTKTPPDKIVYITKCKTCGCKFTYKLKDMCYIVEDILGVYCPECYYPNVPIIKKKYKGDDK